MGQKAEAPEPVPVSVAVDETAFKTLLSQLKNPFMPVVPDKPVVVKPVVVPPAPTAEIVERPSTPERAAVRPRATEPVVTAPNLKLQGVLWDGDKPQAIINNEVVGIGSAVQGSTITAIRKSMVEVSFNGHNFSYKVE